MNNHYSTSELQCVNHKKWMEGTGAEETVVEGRLVESSANKKWVGEGAVDKNRELINL